MRIALEDNQNLTRKISELNEAKATQPEVTQIIQSSVYIQTDGDFKVSLK